MLSEFGTFLSPFVAAVLRSAQAKKSQDDQDDDHQADDVYDAVHFNLLCSESGQLSTTLPRLARRNPDRAYLYQ